MIKHTFKFFGLVLALSWCSSSYLQAETIKIPLSQQGLQSIERPQKGMSMRDVQDAFGEPQQIKGPTGNPPITIWEYTLFKVYFEHSWVIHSVVNHSPKHLD